jgi:hypothetical protein
MLTGRDPMHRACLLLAFLPLLPRGDGAAPEAAPASAGLLVIPLHVHILTSETLPEADCRLTDSDIERIVGKVNRVWAQAGVYFGIESLARERAAHQERYRTLSALAAREKPPHRLFHLLRPEATRDRDGLHVYYIRDFDVNGVYLGRGFAFVKETASLREVEGGLDEPIPRVTAHELAHALGLSHRQDRTNLLASGTTGTALNGEEIERARETARSLKGVRTIAELRKEAESAARDGDLDRSRLLRRWLAEIPGDEAGAAREQPQVLP